MTPRERASPGRMTKLLQLSLCGDQALTPDASSCGLTASTAIARHLILVTRNCRGFRRRRRFRGQSLGIDRPAPASPARFDRGAAERASRIASTKSLASRIARVAVKMGTQAGIRSSSWHQRRTRCRRTPVSRAQSSTPRSKAASLSRNCCDDMRATTLTSAEVRGAGRSGSKADAARKRIRRAPKVR